LDKNGPLLPLNSVKEITQPLTVQLNLSQSTLPELFSCRMPLLEKNKPELLPES
ncbi:9879_t:CDS:1, partial [Gigaspora rosea]